MPRVLPFSTLFPQSTSQITLQLPTFFVAGIKCTHDVVRVPFDVILSSVPVTRPPVEWSIHQFDVQDNFDPARAHGFVQYYNLNDKMRVVLIFETDKSSTSFRFLTLNCVAFRITLSASARSFILVIFQFAN